MPFRNFLRRKPPAYPHLKPGDPPAGVHFVYGAEVRYEGEDETGMHVWLIKPATRIPTMRIAAIPPKTEVRFVFEGGSFSTLNPDDDTDSNMEPLDG